MQAYEGYFINGQFYTAGRNVRIPERRRAIITVLDEPIQHNANAAAWLEFLDAIKDIDDEPLEEFERVKFREVEI